MPEKTIPQTFGTGATRLASGEAAPSAGLFIPDSVLIAAGLNTPSTGTAEGHLVAIVKTWMSLIPRSGFDTDLDQSIYVEQGFPNFTFRGTNNDSYRVDQFTINLAKPDTGGAIDPDDY